MHGSGAGEFAETRRQLPPLVITHCQQDQHAFGSQAPQGEDQRAEGEFIGPLHIVDPDHERRVVRLSSGIVRAG